MARSKRRGGGQWEKIVGEQERSGMSARDFCRGKSIGLTSFYEWRRRFRETDAGPGGEMGAKETFIDMGKIGSSGVSTAADGVPWVVTLHMGEGLKLTLQRGHG